MIGSAWSRLSKEVGLDKPAHIEWPQTIHEISKATNFQLLMWYRHLPSADTDDRIKLMMYMTELTTQLRDELGREP